VITTRLVLCRHGESEAGVHGRICGSLDVALSRRGLEQATVLAAALAPLRLGAVYASPQRRALDTARTIAAEHALTPVQLATLREVDFGAFEGLTHDEAAERRPDVYRSWMDEPARVRFPGGESFGDVRARAAAALAEILGRHDAGSVAVVAHGGVIRAVLAICLDMRDEATFRLDQRYGAVNVVDWLDGAPLVRLVNGDPAMLTAEGRDLSRLYSLA
jgi:broad specificity phosphatase PhoE